MILYRIGLNKFIKDLSGAGAKITGGRWNEAGTPCLYACDSRSLCVLEYSCHVQLTSIPRKLSFLILELPDDSIKTHRLSDLPRDWRAWPHPLGSRAFGTKQLSAHRHLIHRFPSAVIEQEFNYVIDPGHPRAREIRILGVEDYSYDARIKQ